MGALKRELSLSVRRVPVTRLITSCLTVRTTAISCNLKVSLEMKPYMIAIEISAVSLSCRDGPVIRSKRWFL